MNDNELLDLLKKEPQRGLSAVVRQYSAYVMKIAYVKLGEVCTNEDKQCRRRIADDHDRQRRIRPR